MARQPQHTGPVQPPLQPIAARTRSRTHNAFTILHDDDDDDDDTTPLALAACVEPPPMPLAMPVLDDESGKTLEHWQLRHHPKYKDVWDTSYANELGRLCQGIGTDPTTPSKQRVAGTNTSNPSNITAFHSSAEPTSSTHE